MPRDRIMGLQLAESIGPALARTHLLNPCSMSCKAHSVASAHSHQGKTATEHVEQSPKRKSKLTTSVATMGCLYPVGRC